MDRVGRRTQHSERAPATLLMCPPLFYGVEYEINPWMRRRRQVNAHRAHQQWDALYRTITEEVGAQVELAQPVRGQPDFVFAANAGLVVDGVVIPSRFRYMERALEERHWRAWFQAGGFIVFNLPPGLYFEGEGDALLCGDLLVTGFGFRSDGDAVRCAGELLEKETLVLELANPWFYHLDTCFCPLTPETVLYCPQAFTEAAQHAIRMRFPGAIPVPRSEAYRFVCNSIVIGHHVVMAPDCPMTRAELLALGYQVHELDVSEFLKAGGGAKCLALFLERNGRLAGKRETAKRKGAAVVHDA